MSLAPRPKFHLTAAVRLFRSKEGPLPRGLREMSLRATGQSGADRGPVTVLKVKLERAVAEH
eukprot:1496808-Alexandrium_andersonii.AAC.1